MSSVPLYRGKHPNSFTSTARQILPAAPWLWSFIAVLIIWVAIRLISGRGFFGTMQSAIDLAPFLVLVGVGQMFVITAGNGNIDLSVAYLMTLSGFVSMGVMNGGSGSLLAGILAALLCGLAVAAGNLIGILFLSVPPIVATLATGLIVSSAAQRYSSTHTATTDPRMASFTSAHLAGISVPALLCVGLVIIGALVFRNTSYGRWLQAVGQSLRAAELSGINVRLVLIVTYVVCSLLAATAGMFLASYASPAIDLGDPYLLDSIAAVVIGGSLISGGRSYAVGVWGGALFLLLLVTLLNVMHIEVAVQDIVKGVLIICVLSLAGAGSSVAT